MIMIAMDTSLKRVIIIRITVVIHRSLIILMNSLLRWDIAKKQMTMTSSCGVLFSLILLRWEQFVIIIMKL